VLRPRNSPATFPESLDARDGWILLLLLGAFVISRLVWLWLNPLSSGYWEESYRWVVAHELLTRPVQPFLEYQADHYQGGSLVMSLLTVPFFALFGESIRTLKMSALVVSMGTLTMLFIVGRKFFGRPVGVLVGLAYLAGPPLVAFWGLAVMGFHGESILFNLVQIYLFLAILTGRWRGFPAWAALGLISGLGLWFCYTTALSLAACGLTWLLLRGMPRRRDLLWAVAGGILGLVPWFIYNLHYAFQGGVRILEIFGLRDSIESWASQGPLSKLVSLFVRDLPLGVLLPQPAALPAWAGVAVILAFGVPLAVALAPAFWRGMRIARRGGATAGSLEAVLDREERQRELVFVVYAFVFVIMFIACRITVDRDQGVITYRLFTPLTVLLSFPAAMTVAHALRRGGRYRLAAVAGCLVFLTASASATAALAIRAPRENQILNLERGYAVMGVLLHRKFENNLARAIEAADRIPDDVYRDQVWHGIGWGMEYRLEKEGTVDRVLRELAPFPPLTRAGIMAGIQWAAGTRISQIETLNHGGDPSRYKKLLARLRRVFKFAGKERMHLETQLPRPAWLGPLPAAGEPADWGPGREAGSK
jgi:hypothetical protein